jgi:ATP-binding cassette subfamily F protein uup
MESTILGKEAELKKLVAESESPEFARNAVKLTPLMVKIAELQAETERLYARWAELEKRQ